MNHCSVSLARDFNLKVGTQRINLALSSAFCLAAKTRSVHLWEGLTMADGALAPYRMLDLTNERGLLCGKIFADLGADVIRLNPRAATVPGTSALSIRMYVIRRRACSGGLSTQGRRALP